MSREIDGPTSTAPSRLEWQARRVIVYVGQTIYQQGCEVQIVRDGLASLNFCFFLDCCLQSIAPADRGLRLLE